VLAACLAAAWTFPAGAQSAPDERALLDDVASGVPRLFVNNDLNQSYAGERGFMRTGDYNARMLLLPFGLEALGAATTQFGEMPVGTTIPAQALTNLVLAVAKRWDGLRLMATVRYAYR